MKNLSLKITIIVIGVVLLSCKINQLEKKEVDDLVSNESFITEQTIYKGKSYTLSYSINEDSTLNFRDSKSEENYNYLFSNISDKPTASIFISIEDSTVYLFDTNVQYKIFLNQMSREVETEDTKLLIRTNQNVREDITANFNSKELLDSGYVKNNFVYQKDVYKTFSSEGLFGGSVSVQNSDEIVPNNGREAWRSSGVSIKLYEHIYYGGATYEVLSGGESYEEYKNYTININSAFDDETSSFRVSNGTTRAMNITFWEHPNAEGRGSGRQIPRRVGSTVNQYYSWDLTKAKLKPGCWFFCKNWNDRISSVSFTWLVGLAFVDKPIFTDVVNAQIIIDTPIEYEPITGDIANLTLKKTSSSNWWNAGASSVHSVGGYLGAEFQIDSRNTNIMFGLSPNNNGGAAWNTIKYNLYVSKFAGNVIQIYQNGTYKFTYPFGYDVGDVIEVQDHGSFVGFYHNNYFIGSLSHNGSNLYIDTSIYDANAVIRKISN